MVVTIQIWEIFPFIYISVIPADTCCPTKAEFYCTDTLKTNAQGEFELSF